MKNLEVTINLPYLKFNIPEDSLNFHYLERIIFDLTRKIGQELLRELLQIIDNKLMAGRERGRLSNQGKRIKVYGYPLRRYHLLQKIVSGQRWEISLSPG